MYGRIGGNTDAELLLVESKVNEIGEAVEQETPVLTLSGWLDLSGSDSRYTTYNAKTEQSTHIFVADWVQLPENIVPENIVPENIVPENCRLRCGGKRYDVLDIDNPMEMGDGSQLEIYLRYTGGAAQ